MDLESLSRELHFLEVGRYVRKVVLQRPYVEVVRPKRAISDGQAQLAGRGPGVRLLAETNEWARGAGLAA